MIDFSTYVDRDSAMFGVNVDYFIEPYYDPETGEVFSDTSWTVSYGSGGTGGFGSESNFVPIDLGMSGGPGFTQYTLSFFVQNTFSGVSESFSVNVIEAAFATGALTTDGTSGDDLIVSGSGDDQLGGGAGNDFIDAGAGNDQLAGGDGADNLNGGSGADTMTGGAGDDVYHVDSALDAIVEQAGGGTDRVEATVSHVLAANVENLDLIGQDIDGTGNDLGNAIGGTSGRNVLRGLGANDQLFGGAGNDRLEGGEGDDYLDGGTGRDVLVGGNGNDTYLVDSPKDQVIEGSNGGYDVVQTTLANYTLGDNVENLVLLSGQPGRGTGNALDNAIAGNSAVNVLEGGAGNDSLDGREGNDRLIGGSGADQLNGGEGSDWASYEGSTQRVKVNLGAGAGSGGDAAGDTYISIEAVLGGSGNDTLTGDGGANTLNGGAGDDLLNGGAGNDTLIGGAGADQLNGGAGRDTANYAGASANLSIDLAAKTASGGEANGDTLSSIENASGGSGDDTIVGNNDANILYGDAGNDTLSGGDGDDVIHGGAGADVMSGGSGLDLLSYGGLLDGVTVDLIAGTASGADAAGDSFTGFEGAIGGRGNDTLTGDGGNNLLYGGDGDDTIAGGAGNDVIRGGSGSNTLSGGDGIDTLSYADTRGWVSLQLGTGQSYTPSGIDTISGFENVTGGAQADFIIGDEADNIIRGGGGGDYLQGGGGSDRLYGGTGNDSFSMIAGSGKVTVADFGANGDADHIELALGSSYDTFAQVMAAATMTSGGNTVFRFSTGDTLVLMGVDMGTLTAGDFTLNGNPAG